MVTTHRLTGTIDLTDQTDGTSLLAGFSMWAGPNEAGISINDGRGGRPETLRLTDRISMWLVTQVIALIRRNAYRRTMATARPHYRPSPSRKLSPDQVKCVPCLGSGYVSKASELVTCPRCEGRGWMDPLPAAPNGSIPMSAIPMAQ